MKVNGHNWAVNGAENRYRQWNVGNKNNASATQNGVQLQSSGRKSNGKHIQSPADVLNQKEIDTLQALFQHETQQTSFYGRNKIQSVQAGMMLDVKG